MSTVFCNAVNLMANNFGNLYTVHPQLLGDVWNLFELQAIWYEEEKYIQKNTNYASDALKYYRWGIHSFSDNRGVKLEWKDEQEGIKIYAQQYFENPQEIVCVSKKVADKLTVVFTFWYSSDTWKGKVNEFKDEKLTDLAVDTLASYHEALSPVWTKIPETFKNTLTPDILGECDRYLGVK